MSVNLMRFRITMGTSPVHICERFSRKRSIEMEKPILNAGSTNARARILDCIQRRKRVSHRCHWCLCFLTQMECDLPCREGLCCQTVVHNKPFLHHNKEESNAVFNHSFPICFSMWAVGPPLPHMVDVKCGLSLPTDRAPTMTFISYHSRGLYGIYF